MTGPFLTDSHAHLTFPKLRSQLPAVIERARAAGVGRILTVSAELGDFRDVVQVAAENDDTWAAIGVHPHHAAGWTDAHEAELRALALDPKVVAIGEIGLDYHYDRSPRSVQQDVFRRQVRLASEVGKPIVVHSREADDDTARLLAEESAGEIGGVLHCFTSGQPLADRALALGLLVSFSGIVTFRGADAVREVARRVPADRLLVETDAPFLAPEPFRTSRVNEPARVRVTADYLARLRGTTPDELASATTANFERVFLRR